MNSLRRMIFADLLMLFSSLCRGGHSAEAAIDGTQLKIERDLEISPAISTANNGKQSINSGINHQRRKSLERFRNRGSTLEEPSAAMNIPLDKICIPS
jgi:hypothetical protein